MTSKKKRRKSIWEIGKGNARVRIYTIHRKDGYPQHTLAWKEGGRRRTKCHASMDEARLIAQQTMVRLTNGGAFTDDATLRDIEILRHCQQTAQDFGVTLSAAMDEWSSARKIANDISLSEAIRFYQANRKDLMPAKSLEQVVGEFIESRSTSGVTETYVRGSRYYLRRFTGQMSGNIADLTVADINTFLRRQENLGPVSRNSLRRCLVVMFGFAKRQGYLHPDRKTAAEQSESFKVPESDIEIFTPEEIGGILPLANARILPLIAIGAFAGIRAAEIRRLHWEDIKWDRGHIEIAGRKAKTAARRLVQLTDNLKAWLAPWRDETGPIIAGRIKPGALTTLGHKAGIPGGWRQNALRHSFISYRVALTGDVPRTALEAGNSPAMIFRHYREVVTEDAAKVWFSIMPPDGWMPKDSPASIRERLRRISCRQENHPCVDSANAAQP
jgi:integrase